METVRFGFELAWYEIQYVHGHYLKTYMPFKKVKNSPSSRGTQLKLLQNTGRIDNRHVFRLQIKQKRLAKTNLTVLCICYKYVRWRVLSILVFGN